MKVLCFTTSYRRPEMLRRCVLDILNQTYQNIYHSINIVSNNLSDLDNYNYLFDDLDMNRIKITYNLNMDQQKNHMVAIKQTECMKFDVFAKIDDDDIYKKNYIKNIIETFLLDSSIDIISSRVNSQLNGFYIRRGNWGSLGANPINSNYAVPATFAFNNKALSFITDLELSKRSFADLIWRNAWNENNLNHKLIDNNENYIWHIHGKNVSTASFLIKEKDNLK